jgi:MFS family permease
VAPFKTFLDVFAIPGFAGLWLSASTGSFARIMVQLVLSWITLESTGSPFLVGVVMAVRMVPLLVLGIPAGAVADSFDRRTLVILSSGGLALASLACAAAAAAGTLSLPAILTITFILGTLDTQRAAATQVYAYDLVREARATRGIALTNLGAQLLGVLGAILGGVVLESSGPVGAFLIVALASLLGAVGPALGAVGPTLRSNRPAQQGATPGSRPRLWNALTLLGRNRLVAMLALGVTLAEVFGFSHQTLLPTFARDVFDVGAAGLGALTAARSVGGVLSLLLLARLGTAERSGLVFLATGGAFGLALAVFAAVPSYGLALVMLTLAGAAAFAFDALGQTLLQRSTADHERGAAMGIWAVGVWAVGVGTAPLGHLAIGAATGLMGPQPAQAASGALLLLAFLLLATHAPLRRAR